MFGIAHSGFCQPFSWPCCSLNTLPVPRAVPDPVTSLASLPPSVRFLPSREGQGPQDYPQVQPFVGTTHRTQHVVVLLGRVYYREIIKSKVSNGQRSMEEVRHRLPEVLSCRVTEDALPSPSKSPRLRVTCCRPGPLIGDPVPRVFMQRTAHTNTQGLASIPGFQKESRCSA